MAAITVVPFVNSAPKPQLLRVSTRRVSVDTASKRRSSFASTIDVLLSGISHAKTTPLPRAPAVHDVTHRLLAVDAYSSSCFKEDERQRLLGIIESGVWVESFNEIVRHIVRERICVALSRARVDATAERAVTLYCRCPCITYMLAHTATHKTPYALNAKRLAKEYMCSCTKLQCSFIHLHFLLLLPPASGGGDAACNAVDRPHHRTQQHIARRRRECPAEAAERVGHGVVVLCGHVGNRGTLARLARSRRFSRRHCRARGCICLRLPPPLPSR